MLKKSELNILLTILMNQLKFVYLDFILSKQPHYIP